MHEKTVQCVNYAVAHHSRLFEWRLISKKSMPSASYNFRRLHLLHHFCDPFLIDFRVDPTWNQNQFISYFGSNPVIYRQTKHLRTVRRFVGALQTQNDSPVGMMNCTMLSGLICEINVRFPLQMNSLASAGIYSFSVLK